MKAVGIVACSNPQKPAYKDQNETLIQFLKKNGKRVLISDCLYEKGSAYTYTGAERAAALMQLFRNPEVDEIYDISGGDMANEILDFLDFEAIRNSTATFWGYSDLTTVINAIYSRTGKSSVLFQIKNLVRGDAQELQRQRFLRGSDLFRPSFKLVQGRGMKGVVVGGNIRCFLKLAGTRYFPDLTGKILLLEALNGQVPQMVTYLSQLRSCGAFQQAKGILLGTFSEMEAKDCEPDMLSLVRLFAGTKMPIAQTREIGHGYDARAVWIGREIEISDDAS